MDKTTVIQLIGLLIGSSVVVKLLDRIFARYDKKEIKGDGKEKDRADVIIATMDDGAKFREILLGERARMDGLLQTRDTRIQDLSDKLGISATQQAILQLKLEGAIEDYRQCDDARKILEARVTELYTTAVDQAQHGLRLAGTLEILQRRLNLSREDIEAELKKKE